MNKKMALVRKLFKEFANMWKYYGFNPAFYTIIWWINFYIPSIWRFRMSKWALLKKTKWLDRYISHHYSYIISKHKTKTINKDIISEAIIWVFWGQGESSMPLLIRKCHEQLKRNQNNVRLLTLKNLSDYIDIPQIILDKVKTGQITWAHFSDIVRMTLLSKYGGLWIDATVWVPKKIPIDNLMKLPVFSANSKTRNTNKDICFWTSFDYNWSGWCLWTNHTNSHLFSFVADMLTVMASKEKMTLDYVLIDYLIYFAIHNFSDIETDIKNISNIPCKNRNSLAAIMNKPFNSEQYDSLCATDNFFKLSYRANWKSVTADGKQTFYGNLISKI